jgi:redox-sensitive bicupin YhaK (pirin superfamily)
VVAGGLYGARSPMKGASDTMFGDITLKAGAKLPVDAGYEERAIYVVSGEIDVMGDRFTQHQLLVFKPGDALTLSAVGDAHIMLLGGEPMDGPRHIWWNFVHSSRERIEEAKVQWKAGRFDIVPGDTEEFIPLPEPGNPVQTLA